LIQGVAANGFGQAVNLTIQVLSVPLFLSVWGQRLYGEWLLLSTIPGYLSVSDLSFGVAAGNDMTMRVANGDRSGAVAVFQGAWLLVTALSGVFLVGAVMCVHFLPWTEWLRFGEFGATDARVVADLFVLQVILTQQGGILAAGYRCDGNYARGIAVVNAIRLLEFGVSAVALVSTRSPAVVAACVLSTRSLAFWLAFLDLVRRTPWLSLGWSRRDMQLMRHLIGPALSFNAYPLGYALTLQGTLTVVGVLFGPAAATLFSTTRTLTRVVWQAVSAISNTIWVELSAAFGRGDLARARHLHRRALCLAVWLAVLGSLALTSLGPAVFRFWTHGKLRVDYGLFYLMVLLGMVSVVWSTSYIVPMAANRHQKQAVWFLVAGGVSVALTALAGMAFGLTGVPLGLIGAELLLCVVVLRSTLAMLGESVAGLAKAVLRVPWLVTRAPEVGS
jgi:O-antigen/teichoic acid export membrane protein